MLRLVRPVAVWLGVACWLLLSTLVVLPEAFARWLPNSPTSPLVALYSASLGDEWRLLYWVATATGIAIGYLSTRAVRFGAVVGAWLALIGAAVGTWLVYWALFVLPDALTAWAHVARTPQDLVLALGQDLLVLFGVAVLAVLQGAVTGAGGGVVGFGLYSFSHRTRRTQTPAGV